MITMEERKSIAEVIIGMHKREGDTRHATAADLSATLAVALYMLFPKRGKDGRTIVEIIGEQLGRYPNPMMHSAFREETDHDATD